MDKILFTPEFTDRKIRVVFITSGGTTSRGGMGRMALYLTEEFQRHYPGLQIRVLDSYGPGPVALMPFYFAKCFIELGLLCLVRPPDVAHLNLAAHGSTVRKLVLMWMLRAFRIPALLHIHASKFIPFCESLGPRTRKLLVLSLSRASRIVVIGDYWRRYIVEVLGVPARLVSIIHNAVPLPDRPVPRTDGGKCRIVTLGLLGARKGTPELLDALATPVMRKLAWEAVIAGNGEVQIARERAAALDLTTRVKIPGWINAATVAELLATADIFVLPSHNEGLPVSILEAMGAGLPVVTTPVGAIPELVVADTGILVPPGSPDALADALAELVGNPKLRAQLGARARERVEQQFRIDLTAAGFMSIYRSLAVTTHDPT
jgi:glycosyltransferase involved in cell wall biosynthesis